MKITTRGFARLALSALALVAATAPPFAAQGTSQVTVTLVRWPFT
jgi:hypothetical protein